jgi:predicted DNA-binding transcriptional regulator YafY
MADESCRDVYDLVRTAIATRRTLRCTYDAVHSQHDDASEAAEEFELRPYALWYCNRAWYAVGHHGGRSQLRRLKLNRFTSIRLTDHPYLPPDKFDPREDLALAWRMIRGDTRHTVRICFEPDFADNASETRWHCSQQETWDEDGRVTLSFTVDGLEEICWWVLSYGPGATVLEPPELIQRVRDLARATAERYAQP